MRMLKQPEIFSAVDYPKVDDDEPDPVLEETVFEIGVACHLADIILAHMGIKWNDIRLKQGEPHSYPSMAAPMKTSGKTRKT